MEAVLGKQQAAGHDNDAAAATGKRRRGLGAAARNAAVAAEAYPESEAHAGTGADGESRPGAVAAWVLLELQSAVCSGIQCMRTGIDSEAAG